MFSPVGMTVYVNEIIYSLCIKVYLNVILLKFDIHNIFQNAYSPDPTGHKIFILSDIMQNQLHNYFWIWIKTP